MSDRGKALDFSSEDFDPIRALEDPNVTAPCEDVEAKADLDEVRAHVHSQTFSVGENIPGVLGPGGVPLQQVRRTPVQRNFTADQAPLPGKKKRVRNVLTRMEEAKGPLTLLRRAQLSGATVKVYTRNDRGVRGVLTGRLLLFDKHFNLVLGGGVTELFVARRSYKRHGLLQHGAVDRFVTVANLSINETDQDEEKCLKEIAEKQKQRLGGGGGGSGSTSGTSTAAGTRMDLLGQFLASSKDLREKCSQPSTSRGADVSTSDLCSSSTPTAIPTTKRAGAAMRVATPTATPAGVSDTRVKATTTAAGEAAAAGTQGQTIPPSSAGTGFSHRASEGKKTSSPSTSGMVRGKRLNTTSSSTSSSSSSCSSSAAADSREANSLLLGRAARQHSHPEDYNERWDSRQRRRRQGGGDTEAASSTSGGTCDAAAAGSGSGTGAASTGATGAAGASTSAAGTGTAARAGDQALPPRAAKTRGTSSAVKTDLIFSQAQTRDDSTVADIGGHSNVSSESSLADSSDGGDGGTGDDAAGGGGTGDDGGGCGDGKSDPSGGETDRRRKRRRRRKKREIRKRGVMQMLVRGENVVLVSCADPDSPTLTE